MSPITSSSGECRSIAPWARPRSTVVLPQRESPSTRRWGSRPARSTRAGVIVSCRRPSGISSGSSRASGSSSGREVLGEQTDGRCPRAAPAGRALARDAFEGLAEIGVVDLLQQRQGDLREEPVVGQHAPRLVGAEGRGELARDLRVGRVVELELQSRADQALQIEAQLAPARQRHDDVDAEASPALEQLAERLLEVFELRAQRAETVDEQHDVGARQLGETPVGVLAAHVGERVEAVLAEDPLAHGQHRRELFEQAGEPLAVTARRHAADVRERLDAGESAAR